MNVLRPPAPVRGHWTVAFLLTVFLVSVLAWCAGVVWLVRLAWRHGPAVLAGLLVLWLLLAATRRIR